MKFIKISAILSNSHNVRKNIFSVIVTIFILCQSLDRLTTVFLKQTWAELERKSNSSDAKNFYSVFVPLFFALKAELQKLLKFEFH